ncbi:MAG: sigma-54-dependent Fis family transcriptional regulator [Candidatus Marinimicrobia bacterium]|nr:sigma-54-dependent Fis family transcriptional regulator [Candidatus Neomarinimicrobiota bacterium]
MAEKQRPRLLIVDDEQPVLNALNRSLRREFDVLLSLSGPAALQILREQEVMVVLVDQRMPDMTGVAFLKKAQEIQPDSVRVMLTGYSDIDAIVHAVNECQIFYYLQKPWEPETLKMILLRAAEKYLFIQENRELTRKLNLANQQLQAENIILKQEVEKHYSFDNIIGESAAIKQVYALMKKIIPTDTTVLITGETGTGKELVAQAIHYNGPRREKMFVAQNCAALPDTLLESILFGHKKGAFTDAIRDRKGLFEIADGGTIFLDEIAATTPAFQQRLLRVLQEGELNPLGSQQTIKIDVRVISSSNKNLREAVRKNEFREDLFYRINVFPINLPALHDRREDVPLLARHFVKKYAQKMGKQISGISREAELALLKCNYAGNVRELENIIERAIVLAGDVNIITQDLLVLDSEQKLASPANDNSLSSQGTLHDIVDSIERQYIIEALHKHNGNISQAARYLGLSRTGLYKKMSRLNIE